MAGWIIVASVSMLAGVIWLQHRAQRGRYSPLSQRQPTREAGAGKPLGMEATDLASVARVSRVNETLERGSTNWSRRLFGGQADRTTDTDIAPWADDETYAAHYHAAFHKQTTEESPK